VTGDDPTRVWGKAGATIHGGSSIRRPDRGGATRHGKSRKARPGLSLFPLSPAAAVMRHAHPFSLTPYLSCPLCAAQRWAPPIGAAVLQRGAFPDRPPGCQDRAGVVVAGRVPGRPDHCEIEWCDGAEAVREEHLNEAVQTWVVGRGRSRRAWALAGIVLPITALSYAFFVEIVAAPLTYWQVVALEAGSTTFVPIPREWADKCGFVQLRPSRAASKAVLQVAHSAPTGGAVAGAEARARPGSGEDRGTGDARGPGRSRPAAGKPEKGREGAEVSGRRGEGAPATCAGEMECLTKDAGWPTGEGAVVGEAGARVEEGVWIEFVTEDAGLLLSAPPGAFGTIAYCLLLSRPILPSLSPFSSSSSSSASSSSSYKFLSCFRAP
jgi:hypothetical protein